MTARLLARAAALVALVALTLLAPALAFAQDGEMVRGMVRGPDGDPIAGAVVTVSQDGAEIGAATSDRDGTWQVSVPGPGSYDIELDVETLPDGLVPRAEGGELLTDVSVSPGQARTVIFPLVTPEEQIDPDSGESTVVRPPPTPGPPFVERFVQALASGIQYGAVIAICAVGLSLIFGTTRLINFAHGEMVTIGAVVAFFFNVGLGVPLILAGVFAIVAGAAFGGLAQLGLWRPLQLRGTGRINMFIISIGLALLIRHVILVIYGSRPRSYVDYNIQAPIDLGLFRITPRDLGIVVLSVLTLLAVAFMLQRTRIGTAIRAVSDNRDLAESSGINVPRIVLVVWMVGGGLAALGGVLFGLAQVVSWDMGFKLLLLMFAGIILGGLGSAYGAMVGSFAVGIVAHLSTLWFPIELQNAWALMVLIVILLIRPQGILGRRERIG